MGRADVNRDGKKSWSKIGKLKTSEWGKINSKKTPQKKLCPQPLVDSVRLRYLKKKKEKEKDKLDFPDKLT